MTLDERFIERFASAAIEENLVDATFAEMSSPIGRLIVARSREGLCRVAFAEESRDQVLAEVATGIGSRVVKSHSETEPIMEALAAYLEGDSTTLDVPLDLSLVRSGFQRAVLTELQKIERGSITTYGLLAARIGNPRAVRATGTALGRNPIPIVVPCHRVLPSSGGVGNYGGGPDRKRWLLALEGAPLTAVLR